MNKSRFIFIFLQLYSKLEFTISIIISNIILYEFFLIGLILAYLISEQVYFYIFYINLGNLYL